MNYLMFPSAQSCPGRHMLMVLLGCCVVIGLHGCGSEEGRPLAQREDAETSSAAPPSSEELRKEIDEVLDFTFLRTLRADINAAWQIVHGIMAFGPEYEIIAEGRVVRALDWLLQGGHLEGWNLVPGDVGLKAVLEAGSKTGQGHPDQWIGYLAHCNLTPDQTIVARGQEFTLADLLNQTRWDIHEGKEASWTLMGLSSYVSPEDSWTARDGQDWNLEKILRMEAAEDLATSACGGSHRLYGLTMALRQYQAEDSDQALEGAWAEADQVIQDAIEKARQFQNPSGAFSTSYFSRPGNMPDLGLQLGATGHTLEFLTLAVDKEELEEPWMARAAWFLCQLLRKTKDEDLECGALFHAAHGLNLYRQRRFGPRDFSQISRLENTGEQVALDDTRTGSE